MSLSLNYMSLTEEQVP